MSIMCTLRTVDSDNSLDTSHERARLTPIKLVIHEGLEWPELAEGGEAREGASQIRPSRSGPAENRHLGGSGSGPHRQLHETT